MAIDHCRAVGELVLNILQFALNVGKELCIGVCLGGKCSHRHRLINKRALAEKVEHIVVGKCAKETCLGTILAYFGLLVGTETAYCIIAGMAKKFIAERNGVVGTIVGIGNPRVVCVPRHI